MTNNPTPSKELYDYVYGERMYSKSYSEFVKDYSTPQSRDHLYKTLKKFDKIAPKITQDSFASTYFTENAPVPFKTDNDGRVLPNEPDSEPAAGEPIPDGAITRGFSVTDDRQNDTRPTPAPYTSTEIADMFPGSKFSEVMKNEAGKEAIGLAKRFYPKADEGELESIAEFLQKNPAKMNEWRRRTEHYDNVASESAFKQAMDAQNQISGDTRMDSAVDTGFAGADLSKLTPQKDLARTWEKAIEDKMKKADFDYRVLDRRVSPEDKEMFRDLKGKRAALDRVNIPADADPEAIKEVEEMKKSLDDQIASMEDANRLFKAGDEMQNLVKQQNKVVQNYPEEFNSRFKAAHLFAGTAPRGVVGVTKEINHGDEDALADVEEQFKNGLIDKHEYEVKKERYAPDSMSTKLAKTMLATFTAVPESVLNTGVSVLQTIGATMQQAGIGSTDTPAIDAFATWADEYASAGNWNFEKDGAWALAPQVSRTVSDMYMLFATMAMVPGGVATRGANIARQAAGKGKMAAPLTKLDDAARLTVAGMAQQYGSQFNMYREQGLDAATARNLAFAQSLVQGLLENVSPQKYMRGMFVDDFVRAAKALRRPMTRKESIALVLKTSLPEENLQELMQGMAEAPVNQIANAVYGLELDESGPSLRDNAETILLTTASTLVFNAINVGAARQEEISDAMEIINKNPAAFQKYVKDAMDEGTMEADDAYDIMQFVNGEISLEDLQRRKGYRQEQQDDKQEPEKKDEPTPAEAPKPGKNVFPNATLQEITEGIDDQIERETQGNTARTAVKVAIEDGSLARQVANGELTDERAMEIAGSFGLTEEANKSLNPIREPKAPTTPVSDHLAKVFPMSIDDLVLRPDKLQARKAEFSQETVDKILKGAADGTLNLSAIPPVLAWNDNGDIVVLDGHSRHKAFQMLQNGEAPVHPKYSKEDFRQLNVQLFQGENMEDAYRAAMVANDLGTKNTPTERARFAREERERFASGKEYSDWGSTTYGKEWNTVDRLSRLNPEGQLLSDMEKVKDADGQREMMKIAEYVGEARKRFDLTDEHEAELYRHMKEHGGRYNQQTFMEAVGKAYKTLDDTSEPLNMMKVSDVSPQEEALLTERESLRRDMKAVNDEIRELGNRLTDPRNAGYVDVNDKAKVDRLNEVITQKKDERKVIQDKIKDVDTRLYGARKSSKDQGDLFDAPVAPKSAEASQDVAPSRESVTESLNINNPFYKRVKEALVKLGLAKDGDVIGGYVQSDGKGGFAAGDMYFKEDGSISYVTSDGIVEFDKNGNVIRENTKETADENRRIKIEGIKESISSLEKVRDSESFKFKEETETDLLGNKKKVKRLKTAQELKESTDKINTAIDKAKSELAELSGKEGVKPEVKSEPAETNPKSDKDATKKTTKQAKVYGQDVQPELSDAKELPIMVIIPDVMNDEPDPSPVSIATAQKTFTGEAADSGLGFVIEEADGNLLGPFETFLDAVKERESMLQFAPDAAEKPNEDKRAERDEKRAKKRVELDEEAKKDLDEFIDLFDDDLGIVSDPQQNAELEAKRLVAGMKVVRSYTKKGVYKLEDILIDLYDQLSDKIEQFKNAFESVKKAYLALQNDVEDDIVDQMDDRKTVRNLTYQLIVEKSNQGNDIDTGSGDAPQENGEEQSGGAPRNGEVGDTGGLSGGTGQRSPGSNTGTGRTGNSGGRSEGNGTPEPERVKTAIEAARATFPNVDVITDETEVDLAAAASGQTGAMGFVWKGRVYIDPRLATTETVVHEFGHVWVHGAKMNDIKLYRKGLELVEGSEYQAMVMSMPEYQGLSKTEILEEALARAIGEKGAAILSEPKQKSFKAWLKKMFDKVMSAFGVDPDITLAEYAVKAAQQIVSGRRNPVTSAQIAEVQKRAEPMYLEERSASGVLENFYNLSKAKEMEAQGWEMTRLENAFGWHKGPDGKWRLWVPARVSQFGKVRNGQLGDMINVPEIFKAFPDAANITIKVDPKQKVAGEYNTLTKEITVRPDASVGTLLHELQHWVQDREGLLDGPGVDPSSPYTKMWDLVGGKPEEWANYSDPQIVWAIRDKIAQMDTSDPMYHPYLLISLAYKDPQWGVNWAYETQYVELAARAAGKDLEMSDVIGDAAPADIWWLGATAGANSPDITATPPPAARVVASTGGYMFDKREDRDRYRASTEFRETFDAAKEAIENKTSLSAKHFSETVLNRDHDWKAHEAFYAAWDAVHAEKSPWKVSMGMNWAERLKEQLVEIQGVERLLKDMEREFGIDVGMTRAQYDLYKSQAAVQIKEKQEWFNEKLKEATANGFDFNDLGELAHALHSPSRNERVKELRMKAREEYMAFLGQKALEAESIGDTKKVEFIDELIATYIPESNFSNELIPSKWSDLSAKEQINDIDNGSGMFDSEAAAIIQKYQEDPDKYEKMRYMLGEIDQALRIERLDMMLGEGLINEAQYDALMNGTAEGFDSVLENYVPMSVKDEFFGIDAKRSVESAKIMGLVGTDRYLDIDRHNPLTTMLAQYEATVRMVKKNDLIRRLAQNVKDANRSAKDVGLGSYIRFNANRAGVVDANGNMVYGKDIDDTKFDNSLVWMDEGKPRYMTFPMVEERGKIVKHPVVRAFETYEAPWLATTYLWKAFGKVSQVQRMLLTQWNFWFGFRNLLRDIQSMQLNIAQYEDVSWRKTVLGQMAYNKFPVPFRVAAGILNGKLDPETARWWQEAQKYGMKMTWANYAELAKGKDEIQDLIDKYAETGKGNEGGILSKMMNGIGALNDAMENATRLSVYIQLRKQGVPPEKAAYIGKNATLNFEKKGRMAPVLEPIYIFFGAAVQGVKVGYNAATSKKGATFLGSVAIGSAMMRMLMYELMDDDDENRYAYSGYMSETYTLIFLPGMRDPIRIPKPYGPLRVAMQLGESIIDYMYGKTTPSEEMLRMMGQIHAAIDPVTGGSENFVSSLAFSPVRPMVEVALNRAWYDSPIYPTFSNEIRDAESFKATTSPIAVNIAQGFEKGTRLPGAKVGLIDAHPDALAYLFKQYTGGAVKETIDAVMSIPQIRHSVQGAFGVDKDKNGFDMELLPITRNFFSHLNDNKPGLEEAARAYRAGEIDKEEYLSRKEKFRNLDPYLWAIMDASYGTGTAGITEERAKYLSDGLHNLVAAGRMTPVQAASHAKRIEQKYDFVMTSRRTPYQVREGKVVGGNPTYK